MQFKEDTVPLSAINSKDRSFRITTNTSFEDLRASIKNVGLMNPPFLIRVSSGYRIVAGFRRIDACRNLGWSKIDVKILELNTSDLECVKLAITDNSFQRSLNLIEISRSVSLICSLVEKDEIFLKTAIQLGLPKNLSVLKKMEILCGLAWPIQQGVLSGTISLAMALDLGKLEADIGSRMAEIFNTFKLSLNKQREILTLVEEIAAREDLSIQQLLQEKEVKEIVAADDIDKTQKTRSLRLYLKRRRFPEISKTEIEFEKRVKNLKFGPDIQLIPPKNFEKQTYTLQLYFESLVDLKDRKTILDRIIQDPAFEAILKR
jgi:ParB family chromosome partitioning protein